MGFLLWEHFFNVPLTLNTRNAQIWVEEFLNLALELLLAIQDWDRLSPMNVVQGQLETGHYVLPQKYIICHL